MPVRLWSVRIGAIALGFVLAACETTAGHPVTVQASASASASATASSRASSTPRVTTATTLDCTVSWVDHFTALSDMARKADVIVRAVAIAQDTVQLTPGFGSRPTRDARRTTFRVVETLKGAATPEIRVLEDVCPNLDVRPSDEWLLFATGWDNSYGPAGGGQHYFSAGGPQGQFRFAAGRVSGPFFRFADLVHSYEGATIDEVLGDTRAALR